MTQRPQFGDRPFNSGTLTTFTFKRYATLTEANADVANTGFAYVVAVGALFYNVNGVWVSVALGSPGVGVAAGGTTGQVLIKQSNADYDTVWGTVSVANLATTQGSVLLGQPNGSAGTVSEIHLTGTDLVFRLTGGGSPALEFAAGAVLRPANNLSDVSSPSTALANLKGVSQTNALAYAIIFG